MLPHREGIKAMHWVRMFLLVWFSLGMITVAFLFWLCKRTAATVNDPVKIGALPPQRAEFAGSKLSSELRSA
jgi:hypothetical protein